MRVSEIRVNQIRVNQGLGVLQIFSGTWVYFTRGKGINTKNDINSILLQKLFWPTRKKNALLIEKKFWDH